jgi:ubiquinone/menaquinone biosynthesis C-methylase UbiE
VNATEWLQRRYRPLVANLTDLPFPDDAFDVILCSHVLEHVFEDRNGMRELYRVKITLGGS